MASVAAVSLLLRWLFLDLVAFTDNARDDEARLPREALDRVSDDGAVAWCNFCSHSSRTNKLESVVEEAEVEAERSTFFFFFIILEDPSIPFLLLVSPASVLDAADVRRKEDLALLLFIGVVAGGGAGAVLEACTEAANGSAEEDRVALLLAAVLWVVSLVSE